MKFYLFLTVLAFVYAKQKPKNNWKSIDQVNEAVDKYCGPCCVAKANTEPGEDLYNDCVNCCLNPEKRHTLWWPKWGKANCKYDMRTKWPKCMYVINETQPWKDKDETINEITIGFSTKSPEMPNEIQEDVPPESPNNISNDIDRIPLSLKPMQPLKFVEVNEV